MDVQYSLNLLVMTTMLPKNAAAVRLSVKKARGMLEKVETMLGEQRYCIDIAQQVNATIGLLRGMNKEILVSHLQTCGAHKLSSKVSRVRDEFIDEVLRVTDVTSRKS
ncbi:MAG: metal-sensing transcriptional repressor [Holophagales bacterium]|nr:metal-sensing transcriptional repressor [Holophagales bacterium]